MADLADAAGVRGDHGKAFVKKQAGALVETLMRISPPDNRQLSRKSIEASVQNRFALVGNPSVDYTIPADSKHGANGDVHWFLWTHHALTGVAKDADYTKASGDELYELYKRIVKKGGGRIRAGNRGKQAVSIYQKTTVKASAAKKLIARIIGHLGRLKAGYLPAFDELQSSGNIYRPPQWVRKHRSGARGRFQDETSAPQKPSVVITNFAKGVGKTNNLVRRALAIRLKAMKADMQLYVRGVKQKYGV